MSPATRPISTLLIANRGEIACRVIRTARRLGIRTVAVYSEADRHGLHVQMADDAVEIGPPPSAESYLVIDKILQACKQTGTDAVHPGFGFLSENPAFSNALEAAGITFVGPGNKAIEIMGDKITSKALAQQAGVNTIPGHPDAMADADQALEVAGEIGCPVMLKASAGGGGKGMRIAWTLDEVKDNFISAQNEARSAFGDDRVFVEKFIEQPRHIEIQVLGDQHGNCVYLGERECSIQRRHQKVIEEAPSPFIDEATRKAMGEQAVQLAKAVDYHSAGTVEFIVDRHRNFYFLEMNTRLQVEHPVTEYITGLDLVEQMIRVAEGQRLAFSQSEISLTGWAVEARVYAEDPDRNFMPSIGRLTHYRPPVESDRVRVDTGVFEGGEISMYYDPMIAKLVTYGETRQEAINEMRAALDAYVIRGVQHNIPFLAALVSHPSFVEGDMTTDFIAQHYPDGFSSESHGNSNPQTAVVIASWAQRALNRQILSISDQLNRSIIAPEKLVAFVQDNEYEVESGDDGTVLVDGRPHRLQTDWQPGQPLLQGKLDAQPVSAQIDRDLNHWVVTLQGTVTRVLMLTPEVAEMQRLMPVKVAPDMSRYLLSPMPGLLIRVSVGVGDEVKAGQELAVVEAMKMENVLTAERDGVVKKVAYEDGSSLAVDDVIIEFE